MCQFVYANLMSNEKLFGLYNIFKNWCNCVESLLQNVGVVFYSLFNGPMNPMDSFKFQWNHIVNKDAFYYNDWNSMQHQLFEKSWMCDGFECFFFLVCMFGKFESAFCTFHQFACVHLLRSQFKAIGRLCHQHLLWYNDSNLMDLFHHLKATIL
jgi:hypothetical protein